MTKATMRPLIDTLLTLAPIDAGPNVATIGLVRLTVDQDGRSRPRWHW